MKKLGLGVGLLALGLTRGAEVPTLPFEQVQPGMRGTGRTVFRGTQVETFEVEILGKLARIGPHQDLILARCTGGPLEHTGVLAGMSGSPVTVDGKLIGAVAYSWEFAEEAIAGITPIGEMLAIPALDGQPALRASGGLAIGPEELSRLQEPRALGEFFTSRMEQLAGYAAGAAPLSLPISVGGIGPRGLARIAPQLRRAGFLPVQSGGAGTGVTPAPPLQPGSAIGLKLVRGDVEMAATGTATWVDGDRVLAFGHPLFGLGAVHLPLTAAQVETLLPSVQQSARLASPLGEVGALLQDRASGVFGRLGAAPRMVPVRLQLSGGGLRERAYAFDVADDPLLAPLLLYLSLQGIVAREERAIGSATLRLGQGTVIKLAGGQDVALDNLFAGPQALDLGTGLVPYVLFLLMNGVWSPPQVEGVNLILAYEPLPRASQVSRVAFDRYVVRPGESLVATVVVTPYHGPEQSFTREIVIPDDAPEGKLTVQVGGALTINRTDESEDAPLPHDLSQLVRLINQLRRNDRIYVLATAEDHGFLLEGTRLPNLPPSAVRLLASRRGERGLLPLGWRGVFEEAIPTEFAVEGSIRTELRVESR